MDSLESLKIIADYDRAQNDYGLRSIFESSKVLGVAKNGQGEEVIEVQAPRSFLGYALSWLKGISQDEQKQKMVLHAKISQALLQTGIGNVRVNEIISEAMSRKWSGALTKRDLRQMIAKAEESAPRRTGALKQDGAKQVSSASSLSTETNSTVSVEEAVSGEESFRDIDPLAEKKAEELIQNSKKLLKKITFDPIEVHTLLKIVQRQRIKVESYFDECSPGSKGAQNLDNLEKEMEISLVDTDKPVLPPKMLMQLGEQRDHLLVKEKMFSQYLEGDPFSDKNVLYPRRIYAEAAKLVVEDQLPKDESKMPIWPPGLSEKFDAWYQAEVDSYEKASSTKPSQPPEFYLNKKNPENPLVKYKAKYVVDELKKLFLGMDFSVDEISEKEINKAAGTAMSTVLDWKTVKQDMIFSMGEKTGVYHQVSAPLSESETAVGANLRDSGIRGMIPSVRDDGSAPINARLTQLFKMEYVVNPNTGEREEKKVLLHERQQHGINDHFAIQNATKRYEANVNSMKQLIQSGAEADKAFIQDAIDHPEKEHQVFYINTNLTTPTWTPRKNKNNEEAYSRHQGAAMRAVEETQTFSVLNPDDPEGRANVNLNVTCIDFRFPVNYAISSFSEDKKSIDFGMIFAWPALRTHNEGEFRKLFGRLDSQAPIGGILGSTYQKLEEEAANGNQDASKLKDKIDQQIEYVRRMFRTEAYKTAGGDRFKMPRHIDLLVNAFRQASELVDHHAVRVVNAGGCMSGKDREGVANAENEAAVIIQDLGGNVEPGQGGRYHDETQAIYDRCMTGVVHNTRQVTGIGGSKNAQEIASQMSDPHAKIYAQGGAEFVKA